MNLKLSWIATRRAAGMGALAGLMGALPLKGQEALADAATPAVPRLTTEVEGVRLLATTRASERAGNTKDARLGYLAAIDALPVIGDWLRLHAAGLTEDSLQRKALLDLIRLESARSQVGLTEARARERFEDLSGAAEAYRRLGQRSSVLRLNLRLATDSAKRSAARRAVVDFLSQGAPSAPTRELVEALGPWYADLSPAQALIVGRAAWGIQDAPRAVALFSLAFRAGQGTPDDRFSFASALGSLGRYREAAEQYYRITAPKELVSRAAYQRARALLRAGDAAGAQWLCKTLLERFPGDTASASSALFLLAEMARDAGQYRRAHDLWRTLARRYPESGPAPRALLLAGLVLWSEGKPGPAGQIWDSLAVAHSRSEEALAAAYWAGRAWERSGDTARARNRWAGVIARDPLSYYAGVSARRANQAQWLPAASAEAFSSTPPGDTAAIRLRLLREVGMLEELGYESDWLGSQAGPSSASLLLAANTLREGYQASAAIRLGWRALKAGAPADARTYRLIFPRLYQDRLLAEARRRGVDPALVAALIRQESMFEPDAVSRAGARGLMQIMPAVARDIAPRLGFTPWDEELLFAPEVNIPLGVAHLAADLARQGDLHRALAAYNAGGGRVERWNRAPGAEDPEVFVEWIPFVETRNYVRAVLRNVALYQSLYEWPG